jgi:ABC-type bacteriocin/lantibiotic exporter with double-glycine peptidase domain
VGAVWLGSPGDWGRVTPLLTWIVLAAFPFYIGISALATPLFRRRLDEKFQRGAQNQAFLVESVTGVETLKAMAVEPQMQRRWEEQLAGYCLGELSRHQSGQYGEPGRAARRL